MIVMWRRCALGNGAHTNERGTTMLVSAEKLLTIIGQLSEE
jgi:hypothetical protein